MARKNRAVRRRVLRETPHLWLISDYLYKKAENIVACNYDRTWATLSWSDLNSDTFLETVPFI